MKFQEALNYLNLSVKEGFITEEEYERLMNLHWSKMIEEVEKMGARGDAQL